MAHRVSEEPVASLGYLRLAKLRWADRHGTEHDWDLATRTTTSASGIDAVDICAIVEGDGAPPRFLLITQYRPPMDCVCAEFPAGLVDEGETPATAALRELKEETGYVGEVVSVSTPCAYEPGMTDSKFCFVKVRIDLSKEENKTPKQELEGAEDIAVHIVPRSELSATLASWAADGIVPDGKLRTFADALEMATSL